MNITMSDGEANSQNSCSLKVLERKPANGTKNNTTDEQDKEDPEQWGKNDDTYVCFYTYCSVLRYKINRVFP